MGKQIYIWRLDLDTNHDPRSDNLEVKYIQGLDSKNAAHVTGMYPKMIGNIIHMIIFVEKDKELRYFEFDITSTAKAVGTLLVDDLLRNPFTVFMGTKTQSVNSMTMREAYTIGTIK